MQEMRFNSRIRKIPWRREWQPTLVFFPGKFHGQRSLAGFSLEGRKELDMTEQLTLTSRRRAEELNFGQTIGPRRGTYKNKVVEQKNEWGDIACTRDSKSYVLFSRFPKHSSASLSNILLPSESLPPFLVLQVEPQGFLTFLFSSPFYPRTIISLYEIVCASTSFIYHTAIV